MKWKPGFDAFDWLELACWAAAAVGVVLITIYLDRPTTPNSPELASTYANADCRSR